MTTPFGYLIVARRYCNVALLLTSATSLKPKLSSKSKHRMEWPADSTGS